MRSFDTYSIKEMERLITGVGSRPRLLFATDTLGLALAWTCTCGTQMVLQIFLECQVQVY